MKRKKWIICAAVICVAVVSLVLYVGFNSKSAPVFNGERICNQAHYILDFTVLNGEQQYVLPLSAGETLHCDWRIDHGKVDVLIACGAIKAYQGNSIETGSFDLVIQNEGDYTISVKGKQAAGRIEIRCPDRVDETAQ